MSHSEQVGRFSLVINALPWLNRMRTLTGLMLVGLMISLLVATDVFPDASWLVVAALAPAILCIGLIVHRSKFLTQFMTAKLKDVTHRQRRCEALVYAAGEGLAILDSDGIIREHNPAFATLVEREPAQLVGQPLVSLVTDSDQLQAGWLVTAARREPANTARSYLRVQTPSSAIRIVEVSIRDDRRDPAVDGLILTMADRQEVALLRTALSIAAEQDPVTGLLHRRATVARIDATVTRATQLSKPMTLLMLDLDHFRVINANLGHAGGDHVLATISARLQAQIGEAGFAGRFSGDRFAVLLTEVAIAEALGQIEQIVAVVRQPIVFESRSILINLSMGVTERAAGDTGTADILINEAEMAVRIAHKRGHGQVVRYDPIMACPSGRLDLETELRTAITERQFLVYYQPVVALDAFRVVEVEALVRWQHPRRGLVVPDDFIPLAEENGLILPIGWWVIEEACRQGALWTAPGAGQSITISVNLSPRMFRQRDLAQRIAAILERTGLTATRLRLEITECVMINDHGHAATVLRAIKELGVQLAIDDFGTGYCSLAYLQEFPVDVIKIDRRFVATMAESKESSAIVRSIIGLAKSLNLETTGEGIETPDQLACLRELGSDRGQGFLFSRPLPAADLDRILTERTLTGEAAA